MVVLMVMVVMMVVGHSAAGAIINRAVGLVLVFLVDNPSPGRRGVAHRPRASAGRAASAAAGGHRRKTRNTRRNDNSPARKEGRMIEKGEKIMRK